MKEESSKKLRVTIDTNLVISGIMIPGSIPAQLLKAYTEDKFNLVLTVELFNEIKEVLSRDKIKKRYNSSDNQIRELLDELAIAQEPSFSRLDKELPVHSRDTKDDKVLRCAIMGKCDYLITGDEDLLILNGRVELGNLHIVKAADFLKRYLK